LELNNETDASDSDTIQNDKLDTDRTNPPFVSEVANSDVQFERDRQAAAEEVEDVQNTQAETVGVSQLLHGLLETNRNYTVEECGDESDDASSELEISLQVEPSCKIREMLSDDDSETGSCEVDVKSEMVADDDQTSTLVYVSSPGSNLSWRSCTSAVCELEKNDDPTSQDCIESASGSNVRGITLDQVAAYRKFCDMKNTVRSEPEDDDDDESASFPYVDTIDTLTSEDLDSDVHHTPLNNNSLLQECHHPDCFGTESWVNQMNVKGDETLVEESSLVDEDGDEVCECSPDTRDPCVSEDDVQFTIFTSAHSKNFTGCIGFIRLILYVWSGKKSKRPSFCNNCIRY